MKDQPQLEGRVRYRQPDIVVAGLPDGVGRFRMIGWPLDVENAPDFVDLGILRNGLGSQLASPLDKRERNCAAIGRLDPDVDFREIPDGGLPLERPDVRRFGRRPLAEYDNRLPDWAVSDGSSQGRRLASDLVVLRPTPTAHQPRPFP